MNVAEILVLIGTGIVSSLLVANLVVGAKIVRFLICVAEPSAGEEPSKTAPCGDAETGGGKTMPMDSACLPLVVKGGLTNRESEIIVLVAKGHGAHYVADVLSISLHTAKSHIHNIYRKLNVHSREDLIALAETEAKALSVLAEKDGRDVPREKPVLRIFAARQGDAKSVKKAG